MIDSEIHQPKCLGCTHEEGLQGGRSAEKTCFLIQCLTKNIGSDYGDVKLEDILVSDCMMYKLSGINKLKLLLVNDLTCIIAYCLSIDQSKSQ